MTTYLSTSSLRRAALAELRGWALLAGCFALTSGFVAAFWEAPAQATVATAAAWAVAPEQVASAR
jgi:hypothetical protein